MSMSSIQARGQRLYAKLKDINNEWQRVRTQFVRGQEAQAETWAEKEQREIDQQRALKPAGEHGPLTVTRYATKWLGKRKNKTVKDDRTRMERHVLPRIGHLLMTEVRPRHLRDVILELRNAGELSPRSIRNISGLVHTMFKSAIIDEVIKENPAIYEKGVLPKKLDKDPSWRREAIYTRVEVEQLISDERIPIDRRVLYALKFFTGRHTEVCKLTWSQYDQAAKPLGALALDETKSDVPRLTPVHPTLAKILAAWKLSGWEDLYGHRPKPHDLIVPTRNLAKRASPEAQKQLKYDLAKIGLRVKAGKERSRRGHDLRRTLITLARSDGAIDGVLKCITHGPSTAAIIDLYTSYPWETLCTEIAKLKIELRTGTVIEMPRGPSLVQGRKTRARGGLRAFDKRPQRDSNPYFLVDDDARHDGKRRFGRPYPVPPRMADADLDQTVVQAISRACSASLEIVHSAIRP